MDGDREYTISLDQFVSSKYNAPVTSGEIIAVNFGLNGNSNAATQMIASLSKVRFSKVAALNNDLMISIGLYPNPTSSKFTVNFTSEKVQDLVLKVTDITTGRVIKTLFVSATKGINQRSIDLSTVLTNGNYVVTLEGDDVKYAPAKLTIIK